MHLLCLFTAIVLSAPTGQAKVVNDFSECKNHFYKSTEPVGMDQNAIKICQMYGYGDSDYATLYSTHHRIPLYSAYTLARECTTNQGATKKNWLIEPQISKIKEPRMSQESEVDRNKIMTNQAINSDYHETGYDRGHLNPNSFQCGDGREATFTLTNAAPMDPCFNRIYWKNCESSLRQMLLNYLKADGKDADVYLVTGTVPDSKLKIPQRENPKESQRVTVPSHIWTAVCYKHKSNDKSFSFGYIGQNRPVANIIPMSVPDLNKRLSKLYSSDKVSIFLENCFSKNLLSEKTMKKFQEHIENKGTKMTPDAQNIDRAVKRVADSDSDSPVKVTKMCATLSTDSLKAYSIMAEEIKNVDSACLITKAKKSIFPAKKGDVRKRDVSEQSVECQVVPEKSVAGWKTAADGSPCQSISESSVSCNCITESGPKPCCSTPCLYRQGQRGYWCYSGQTLIQCSPQYSLITFKGERCKDNYPCATYGKDYYWCQKSSGTWDYCSPPLFQSKGEDGKYCQNNYACAKYGEMMPYCYTDDNNKKACCINDDCFSAVNGKTCKSDHPCGYYGLPYLWCNTTDGRSDNCCTNCT